MIRVFVYTSDPYLWLMKPFSYLFGFFWSDLQEVIVGGFTPPRTPLPPNFHFHQINEKPYPKNKWSTGLIEFLGSFDDDIFILMLEDYLLRRTVDHGGISTLADYMRLEKNSDVVRLDLTNDRLNTDGMHDIESWGHYDIISCNKNSMYEMSLQAAIWNRHNLLGILHPGLTPWEVELQTNMVEQPYRVLGTRQFPLRYANLMLKGAVMDYELDNLPEPQRSRVRKWIPR
jgi:hypothetical protein